MFEQPSKRPDAPQQYESLNAMKPPTIAADAADFNAGRRLLSGTWLSIGAVVRLSATMMVLAGVWLLVGWAVVLP